MSYANTALLLPLNGANGGTSFPDWSRHDRAATRAGNTLPTTTTAQSKFYGSSGFFPSNGSGQPSHLRYLSAPTFGTGLFTIRAWARMSATGSFHVIADSRAESDFSSITNQVGNWSLVLSTPGALRFSHGAGVNIDSTATWSANTWHHVEVTRDGSNVIRLFLDGILDGSSTVGEDFTNPRLTIGGVATSTTQIDRWVQDLQIIPGVCLHTASFTPPDKLIAPVAGTITDDTGAAVERRIWVIPRAAESRMFTGLSDAGDGSYSIDAPDVECARVVLDDDAGTQYNDLIDRVAVAV